VFVYADHDRNAEVTEIINQKPVLKILSMKRLQPGAGFTIFIIFFGLALLESIRDRNYLLVLFWICIALVFLFADKMKKQH
jgi:hypothetical protein